MAYVRSTHGWSQFSVQEICLTWILYELYVEHSCLTKFSVWRVVMLYVIFHMCRAHSWLTPFLCVTPKWLILAILWIGTLTFGKIFCACSTVAWFILVILCNVQKRLMVGKTFSGQGAIMIYPYSYTNCALSFFNFGKIPNTKHSCVGYFLCVAALVIDLHFHSVKYVCRAHVW